MDNFKVSKKAWHWKIYNFFNYKKPKNFCDYFWDTVLYLIGLLSCGYVIFNLIFGFHYYWPILLGVIVIYSSCVGAIALKRKLFNKNGNQKENKDGLLKIKFKSWKGKYCPGIEIVEE